MGTDETGKWTAVGMPDEQQMMRATTALGPFVRRWNLPLNPEDLAELAYAVLRHARSDDTPEQIVDAVEHQLDEHEAAARRLTEAMRADRDRRGDRG